MRELLEIINSIGSDKPNINPTVFFDEGWMTRFLVKKSIEKKLLLKACPGEIDFATVHNWTSEALIDSPFVEAPEKREGYTHADIALGDFSVKYATQGKIIVDSNAKLFGIIEAKMKSNLSQGTKHAKDYNQASRNLACIAKNTLDCHCKTFFAVVGPEKYLEKYKIRQQIEKNAILAQIKNRFSGYGEDFQNKQRRAEILARMEETNIFAVSYKDWINCFDGSDRDLLQGFYDQAAKWNRLD